MLRKYRAFDEGTIQEIELHLRDNIEDLTAKGITEKEAFRQAVNDFGEVGQVAKEEYTNIKMKASLRSLLFRAMLNNYFKTTLRSMMKNPLTSFINVFGLAVAIGVSIVVYATLDFDYRIDRHHVNENEIYLTTFFIDRDGDEKHYGLSPAPLGKMIEQDYSSISAICRLKDGNAIVKKEDDVFNESIRLVDPTFLEFFTFPLSLGDPNSLQGVNNIVISDGMAKKYFGNADPIGEQLLVKSTDRVIGNSSATPVTVKLLLDFSVNFTRSCSPIGSALPKYFFA
ncbi:MAG: permease prefix domain 1-containing protein, partial [Bacteroidota bacterium]